MQQQSSIQKEIQLTNQLTGQIFRYTLKIIYIIGTRQLNISKALQNIHSNLLNLNHSHIFYLNQQRKMFVFIGTFPFNHNVMLQYGLFLDGPIRIRFKKLNPIDNESKNNQSQILQKQSKITDKQSKIHLIGYNPNQKQSKIGNNIDKPKNTNNKKVVQRTIGEIVGLVERWKQIYQQCDSNGKRIHTFDSAAKLLQLPTKTLHDYSYKIKLGTTYNFDFKQNWKEKIGKLRSYVKIHHPKKKQRKKKKTYSQVIEQTNNYWVQSSQSSGSLNEYYGDEK